jgi:hypothetical protein
MNGMNKAFCKEPDSTAPPRCPACGNEGVQVTAATLAAHSGAAESLGEPAYCCGSDSCDVAYFDLLERSIPVAAATGLVWPKDPAGPLCSCHGLTADDVDDAVRSGELARIRDVIRMAAGPDAQCGTKSPDGRPCTPRVQRFFMRRRQELGGR